MVTLLYIILLIQRQRDNMMKTRLKRTQSRTPILQVENIDDAGNVTNTSIAKKLPTGKVIGIVNRITKPFVATLQLDQTTSQQVNITRYASYRS